MKLFNGLILENPYTDNFVVVFKINIYICSKNQYLIMPNDVSESISQGFDGEETEETRRIQEIADELGRRCGLYETQFREGKADGDGRIPAQRPPKG